MANESVVVLNDYDSSIPMQDYDVKYEFYEEECYKYIRDIESSSFDLELKSEDVATEPQPPLIPINKNAKILPAKFGMSGGAYRYDEESGNIYRGIGTINYLTDEVGEKILLTYQNNQFEDFVEFMVYNTEELKLNSRQMIALIKIGYFEDFGTRKNLLEFYKEFTKGKNRYTRTLKDATKESRLEELKSYWSNIPDREYSIPEIVKMEYDIAGQLITSFNVNPRFVVIENSSFAQGVSKRGRKWKRANLTLKSLNTTKSVDVTTFDFKKESDFKKGNLIFCNQMHLQKSEKYGDQWMLDSYQYPVKIV